MLNNELLNKDTYVVPEQAPIIILDEKSTVCMANNGNDTKHTIRIDIIMHSVRNDEECNLHYTVWYEGVKKLADIGTKNVRKDELNPRLGYDIVRLENCQNTCKRGVTGYRRV